jgi:hypothetical protein
LVIEDTPCLERLIPFNPHTGPVTIRVIRAPKLKILGLLSEGISTLIIGTTVFQVSCQGQSLIHPSYMHDIFLIFTCFSFSTENGWCQLDNQNAHNEDFSSRVYWP